MKVNNEPISMAISHRGGDIAITTNGRLTIGPYYSSPETPRYDLGEATEADFDRLITSLERLKLSAK